MTTKIKSQIKFTKSHYGKWVALSSDKTKILSYSSELSTLRKKVGSKNVVFTKALDPSKSYAF